MHRVAVYNSKLDSKLELDEFWNSNTRRWCIACQNRFNCLSSRSVEIFCVQRNKLKKLSGNFGYMGRSNPWDDVHQMWRVGRYGGRNHVCNIWWLSVKGCGCSERGNFAFSHWLDVSPLQHYRVTVIMIIFHVVALHPVYHWTELPVKFTHPSHPLKIHSFIVILLSLIVFLFF